MRATATSTASGPRLRWNPTATSPSPPAAAVLNYGQGIFEGMKAFRTVDGEVVTFRPDQNAARFAEGAGRMSMPPVPEEIFVDAVKKCISANRDFIPPEGKGSLYLRPLLIGTGPILGLGPAPSYTFLVYCSPVASYSRVVSRPHRPRGGGVLPPRRARRHRQHQVHR